MSRFELHAGERTCRSVLVEVCWASDVLQVDHMQSASRTASWDPFDVVSSDDVALHLELEEGSSLSDEASLFLVVREPEENANQSTFHQQSVDVLRAVIASSLDFQTLDSSHGK